MVYLFVNSIIVFLFSIKDRLSLTVVAGVFVNCIILFFVSLLPSLQDGVSADYSGYVSIIESGSNSLARKNEYFPHMLIEFVRSLGLGAQLFFALSSFFMSLYLLYAFEVLGRRGFSLSLIFFLFFAMTGMLHNQMNLVKTYLAVYCFVAMVFCKYDKSWFLFSGLALMGYFSHQSFVIALALLLVPSSVYVWAGRNFLVIFLASSLFYLVVMQKEVISFLIEMLLPFYSHYLDSEMFLRPGSILSIMSGFYCLPILFLFSFLVLPAMKRTATRFELYVLGYSALFSSAFLMLVHSGIAFRVLHYFSFFTIFPIYFFMLRSSPIVAVVTGLYVLLPYTLLVLVFKYGGYDYHSVIW